MVALYLKAQQWPVPVRFAVYTFAAPTAGTQSFADYYNAVLEASTVRTVNVWDVVPQAWNNLDAVKQWFLKGTGPIAGVRTQEIIGVFAGMPKNNVYVQPCPPSVFNNDPDYGLYDPALTAESVEDFMGQAAFQHANSTYLTLLNAPPIPPRPIVAGIDPQFGSEGTSVTINGSGFGQD